MVDNKSHQYSVDISNLLFFPRYKEKEEENKLPKGATMFMEGFKDDTTREDIKEALKLQFDVELKAFAFMEFEKGIVYLFYFIIHSVNCQ